MKLIKETNIMKVWKCENGKFITGTDATTAAKYIVIDLRAGKCVFRTDSLKDALEFNIEETIEEKVIRALESNIKDMRRKNLDFNERPMDVVIREWNKIAIKIEREEFIITETFRYRNDLANKFAEILEAL